MKVSVPYVNNSSLALGFVIHSVITEEFFKWLRRKDLQSYKYE
jgi:hypothetical protein